jgi:subtilisin family serine protease
MLSNEKTVHFEAVLKSETGQSMFDRDRVISVESLDDFEPPSELRARAATALSAIGFRVRHIGAYSISCEASPEDWQEIFQTKIEQKSQAFSEGHPEVGEVNFWSPVPDVDFTVPDRLQPFIERAYPQPPPIFFESPLPPRVAYHHLRVPDDVAMLLRSTAVHNLGIAGAGVLVAMPDTGFYAHPFYSWHGYNYNATLSPDAVKLEEDEVGHGTAEAANIFANAPNIDFVGIKMGGNATLAFKTAADLSPAVMTNSWGYNIKGPNLPNYLKPLEAAVIDAVRNQGITVCFSAGNGHYGFPGQMPEVISVGGVYAEETLGEGDFELKASDYASSFDSQIYPGRHVPDVCGLVGMKPGAVYIMLPVEPEDQIDEGMSSADTTDPDDGWAVISGTSAASPQIAGVCALLKEVRPGLSPALVKAILRASARDVTKGVSAMGQEAGEGHDGATGAGLVDAHAAYKLARSITPRNLHTLPSPR